MTANATHAVSPRFICVLIGALLGAAAMILANAPAAHADNPVPIVVAHRGGVYTYPENTYPGLVAAARLGQIIETDVRFTADGVAVLAHDADTTRVLYCGGSNYVIARTLFSVLNRQCLTRGVLSRSGARYHLARYASVLSAVQGIPNVRVWPEIKTTLTATDTRRFIEPLIADNLITHTRITSFNGPSLQIIRQQALTDYQVRVHTLLYEAGQGVSLSVARSYGVDVIGPSYFCVHAHTDTVQNAHAEGIGVAVYNADDPAHWANLRSLGIDWTVTNHPNAYAAWARS